MQSGWLKQYLTPQHDEPCQHTVDLRPADETESPVVRAIGVLLTLWRLALFRHRLTYMFNKYHSVYYNIFILIYNLT
jgi:hypothetical protein